MNIHDHRHITVPSSQLIYAVICNACDPHAGLKVYTITRTFYLRVCNIRLGEKKNVMKSMRFSFTKYMDTVHVIIYNQNYFNLHTVFHFTLNLHTVATSYLYILAIIYNVIDD